MSIFCRHKSQTSPRRDKAGTYTRCLTCTARLPWKWGDTRKLKPPKLTAPRLAKRS
jgi:hypothetical protein